MGAVVADGGLPDDPTSEIQGGCDDGPLVQEVDVDLLAITGGSAAGLAALFVAASFQRPTMHDGFPGGLAGLAVEAVDGLCFGCPVGGGQKHVSTQHRGGAVSLAGNRHFPGHVGRVAPTDRWCLSVGGHTVAAGAAPPRPIVGRGLDGGRGVRREFLGKNARCREERENQQECESERSLVGHGGHTH